MRACPLCSKPNADDRNVCLHCGAAFARGSAAAKPLPKFEMIEPPAPPPSKVPRIALIVAGGGLAALVLVSMVFKMMGGSYKDPRRITFKVDRFVDPAAFREALQPPYLEGKLLFVHAWSSHPDSDLPLLFPKEMIATKEDEVGTVVWLECTYRKVGDYKDVETGAQVSEAFKGKTEVAVVNVRTREILCRKTFAGRDPPGLKKSSESALGSLADGEIARFVLDLPRR